MQKTLPEFKAAFANLENRVIQQCNADWFPKTFGYMSPNSGAEYGRTTILPELFQDWEGNNMDSTGRTQAQGSASWIQAFDTQSGDTSILTGNGAGSVMPESFKVAWIGLAFPNKTQHITEIKFQISDRKYGRLDLEEMLYGYDAPAVIFEEGFVIDEETYFELWAYLDLGYSGLQPENGPGGRNNLIYQSVVMLGACYYKQIDRVLGDTGAPIA